MHRRQINCSFSNICFLSILHLILVRYKFPVVLGISSLAIRSLSDLSTYPTSTTRNPGRSPLTHIHIFCILQSSTTKAKACLIWPASISQHESQKPDVLDHRFFPSNSSSAEASRSCGILKRLPISLTDDLYTPSNRCNRETLFIWLVCIMQWHS